MRRSQSSKQQGSHEIGIFCLLEMLNITFHLYSIGQVANGVLVDSANARSKLDCIITKVLGFEVYMPQARCHDFL
jgi:hypothetical protein